MKPPACVTDIKLRDFRCYHSLKVTFEPGINLICGANAQGKTSLLEAVCVMLRLNSPRSAQLATLIRHQAHGLVIDGHYGGRHLQFYYSKTRRKLALDSLVQSSAAEYLTVGKAVYFANDDIRLVRNSDAGRRRLLDLLGAQIIPGYRLTARSYEKALQARNRLLKTPGSIDRAELQAFTAELARHGDELTRLRRNLLEKLRVYVRNSYHLISSGSGVIDIDYEPSAGANLAAKLTADKTEEIRLRQTLHGPHRDVITFKLNNMRAAEFASEGQQRTIALALRMAEGELLSDHDEGMQPVYLIDDVFGELDQTRRHALFTSLPNHLQWLVTCTSTNWLDSSFQPAAEFEVANFAVLRKPVD